MAALPEARSGRSRESLSGDLPSQALTLMRGGAEPTGRSAPAPVEARSSWQFHASSPAAATIASGTAEVMVRQDGTWSLSIARPGVGVLVRQGDVRVSAAELLLLLHADLDLEPAFILAQSV